MSVNLETLVFRTHKNNDKVMQREMSKYFVSPDAIITPSSTSANGLSNRFNPMKVDEDDNKDFNSVSVVNIPEAFLAMKQPRILMKKPNAAEIVLRRCITPFASLDSSFCLFRFALFRLTKSPGKNVCDA